MRVKVTYFKAGGKWYADATADLPRDTPEWTAASVVLGMNPSPGLLNRWSGHILVTPVNADGTDGVPHLVVAEVD
jgi:hypothetical protein